MIENFLLKLTQFFTLIPSNVIHKRRFILPLFIFLTLFFISLIVSKSSLDLSIEAFLNEESYAQISLDDINEYYQNNKDDFTSSPEAEFSYIRLNKKNIISSIQVAEEEIKARYDENLKRGLYSADKLYEINHLVFPIRDDKDNVMVSAKKAYEELLSNKSFEYISNNYDVSEDTRNSSGYLGQQALIDLPDIIKSNISKMQNGEIKLISSQSNAVHIIQLIDASSPGDKTYDQVKREIRDQISNTKGTAKYFSLLDSIKEKLYANNNSLTTVSYTHLTLPTKA
mgnify:CR=1 FL=1